MVQWRSLDATAPLNAPDSDLFNLIAFADAVGAPVAEGTMPSSGDLTGVAPLAWEGVEVSSVPFYVVDTDNFVLSLENWVIQNAVTVSSTAAAVHVWLQQFQYNPAATVPPFGVAGPVIYPVNIAAAGNDKGDNTKTRLTCPPGFFLVMFAGEAAGAFDSDTGVTFAGRARYTPG